MEPIIRNVEIEDLLASLTGKGRPDTIRAGKCMTCNVEQVPPFRDALSVKEYTISGMCQQCQDSVFS